MMAAQVIACPYCKRQDFASKGGLTQHIRKTPACAKKDLAAVHGKDEGYMTATEFLKMAEISREQYRIEKVLAHQDLDYLHKNPTYNCQNRGLQGQDSYETAQEFFDDNGEDDDDNMEYEEDEFGDNIPVWTRPDKSLREDFDNYVQYAEDHLMDFTHNEQVAIELMSLLRRTKASLDTYEQVMEWHFLACKKIRRHETVGKHPDFISRRKLFNRLKQRYNLTYKEGKKWVEKHNIIKEITLPSTRAKARIVKNDVRAMIQSLLTDPRIKDEDYLFFNDDPFCPPPEFIEEIGDLNTGQSFRSTHVTLITNGGKKILLPFVFYIDGAATGQFADLPVTQLKFTLGIFTKAAREKPHMWRILGYVPKISKNRSRGRRKLQESGHVDSAMAHQDMGHGEGNVLGAKADKAQDLHAMLEEILEDFLVVQESGFLWDLAYKDEIYEKIEMVPYVAYFKVDTDEAEKLTGKYTSRTGNVKCLCRFCCCPTSESDNPRANYPRKTVEMIAELVQNNDRQGLKNLSQHNINNALYKLKFGTHNGEGIHGACPMEMLHALLLGIFKYVRDCFFEQIGDSSALADEINALAVEYGDLFCRQSDRDLPKTKFGNGIRKGKLMAKEYRGVLLIMAAILRSTEGRRLLKGKKGSTFAEKDGIEDWTMLVETLLQWEVWLKSDVMKMIHVLRSEKKHRYIMYLIRRVGRRVQGMGLKITKFHTIMHMTDDILKFGVPMNYDTGSDESGHKPSKTAARLTQKRADTFDVQIGARLQEVHCLDLAMEEIVHHRPVFDYYKDQPLPADQQNPAVPPHKNPLGGSKFEAFEDETGRNCMQLVATEAAKQKMNIEQCFVDFVAGLTECVDEHIHKLQVRTNHYRNGAIFRGTPMHNGAVWRDWVMIDWGEDYGVLPNKIWGFVNLLGLPQNNDLKCGGLSDGIPPAVYAIVESSEYVKDDAEKNLSELFVPITKEVGRINQRKRVTKLKFYLADVEGFVEGVGVIPDIGGAPNAYFICRQRPKWGEEFVRWLESEHEDFEDFSDDEEQEDWDEDAEIDDGEEEQDDESSQDSGDE